jgi:nucleoside-diphosphate-sugar epimerase
MKIVITGIHGFIGSNLSYHLSGQGYRLTGISRSKIDERNLYDKIYTWDELPGIRLSADVWIHLAGLAHDTRNSIEDSEYEYVNVKLAECIFTRFRKDNAPGLFIYFSSVKAIASSVHGVLFEDDRYEVDTVYGRTKRSAEELMLKAELPPGKKLVILRPCMIHGPGNKGNLNLLYSMIQRGVPYPLGAFNNKRSFLTLDNLIFIIDEIIQNLLFPSGVYHIADDEPLSTIDVVRVITSVCNKKEKIWNISPRFIKAIATLGDLLRLPFNSERLNKLTEDYVVSNEKIKKVLKKPLPVSSREGLKKTIESFEQTRS